MLKCISGFDYFGSSTSQVTVSYRTSQIQIYNIINIFSIRQGELHNIEIIVDRSLELCYIQHNIT